MRLRDTSLFNVFDKCRYEYIGKCELASLAEKAQEYDNALIIVNKRKTAKGIYMIFAAVTASFVNIYDAFAPFGDYCKK